MQSRDTVAAVFNDRDDAQDAINALRDAGFAADDISILARDRNTAGQIAEDTGTEMATGAATGALAGGLLGGVAGWLVGIGALAIPGVGPIIAAGPLAAALGGAAIGAAGGGIIGALTGMGIPEDEAKYYDTEFKRGGIVVTAQTRGRYDEARDILREYGGRDATTATTTSYATWNETSPRFRSSYEQRYGTSRPWADVEPAHRYGYESYGRTRQAGTAADFDTAEPSLRQEWSRSGSTGDYDTNRTDVRRGWDYGRGRTSFRDYDNEKLGTEHQNKRNEVGGAVGGAVVGGAAGAVVGGPIGAAAGAVIGGTAGEMAGDASVKTPREKADEIEDERRKEMRDRR